MDNCSQVCTNTEGGFTCSCRDGYTLEEDGPFCEGVCTLDILSIFYALELLYMCSYKYGTCEHVKVCRAM